jgi:hypothetical protein
MANRQLTIVKAQISDVVITLRIPAFTTESIKEAPSVPQLDPRTGETRAFPDDPMKSYTPVVLGLDARVPARFLLWPRKTRRTAWCLSSPTVSTCGSGSTCRS